ncbi:MAG: hypothetical protein JSR76_03190 [Verrucomicrobia bacterium]|nr:hypothetical protein [Verrucomicrobiota bacterium]
MAIAIGCESKRCLLAERLFSQVPEEILNSLFDDIIEDIEIASPTTIDAPTKTRLWTTVCSVKAAELIQAFIRANCDLFLGRFTEEEVSEILAQHTAHGTIAHLNLWTKFEAGEYFLESRIKTLEAAARALLPQWKEEIRSALTKEEASRLDLLECPI